MRCAILVLLLAAILGLSADSSWALPALSLAWEADASGGIGYSPYYMNVETETNSALVPLIAYGVHRFDNSGTRTDTLDTSGIITWTDGNGAKSIARIGDYYYVTSESNGALMGRLDATGDNAWDVSTWTVISSPGIEAITTDGNLLFANDDANRNMIHAYDVNTTFSLTSSVWDATLGSGGGRVRGVSYDPDSGQVYASLGGGSAGDFGIYAINASTGTPTLMGTHESTSNVYRVLRYGDELLVFEQNSTLSIYDVDPMTLQIGADPTETLTLGGSVYGAAILPGTTLDTLFVSSWTSTAACSLRAYDIGSVVPEPTSLALLGLGGFALLIFRRNRRRSTVR